MYQCFVDLNGSFNDMFDIFVCLNITEASQKFVNVFKVIIILINWLTLRL